MNKKFLLFFIFSILFVSCGYKPIKFDQKQPKVYCIKKIDIPMAEATAYDVLTQKVSDAIISSNNILECSTKTERYIYIKVRSIEFEPIGFSSAQRATIYKMSIVLDFKVEDDNGKTIFSKEIKETTQYIGAGLRADFERRYAFENLAELIRIRIFSLLVKI